MKNLFKDSLKLNVEILSVNVSAFTQDVLLWNGAYESSFKLILPSHTRILADNVELATKENKDLLITGVTMGGGPFNKALNRHLEKGLKVYMTPDSARTIRDDLDHVKEKGITIIEDDNDIKNVSLQGNMVGLVTLDVDLVALNKVCSCYGLKNDPKAIAIGVEDHGTGTGGLTDREIRFDYFKTILPARIGGFGFSSPPARFTRMIGVKKTLEKYFPDVRHLIMDSKIAAVFGAAAEFQEERVIVVDVGYGHTIVASLDSYELTGIFEHHTRMLTNEKLWAFLNMFREGQLTNKEIFEDGGHGCSISRPIGDATIIVSGPMSASLFMEDEFNVKFENPYKDPSIRGNIGLIEGAKSIYNI